MANKRKTTTAIAAGVTALALLLGGTFAWTSISQQAKNEAIVDINPGGRLHDDFNGTNKDVYVENFSSGATGVDIFARIRLDQYFEVGQDAGINKDGTDRKVTQVLGTDINDESTWITYKPGDTLGAPVQANDNWQWTLGNDDTNMPYYMPTFNMNKDSLAADINGTYEGTVEGDIVHYDDYVVYVDAEGNPKTVAGTEVYDWDDENAEEEPNPEITYDDTTPRDDANVYHKTKNDDGTDLTHTAKQISSTATVYTMAEWIAAGSPVGPYWVYDTDGWAYWAQPIAPGETTGLLLDGISMSKVPDDNYYYGINVVGQFATKGDIYQFEGMSPEAEVLFGKVTNSEEIVISGPDTVNVGVPTTFTATRNIFGEEAEKQPTFTWTATDADGADITGVTMVDGTLTVDETVVAGTKSTVTATASDVTATLAEGDEATTNTVAGSKTVTVIGKATVTADGTSYKFGKETTVTLTAAMEDTTLTGAFTWSVTDADGNVPANGLSHVDADDASKATLTVGATETAEKLIVTATFNPTDSEAEYSGICEIARDAELEITDELTAQAYAIVVPNDDLREDEETGELTAQGKSLVFIRTNETITNDISTYNGATVESYASFDETAEAYDDTFSPAYDALRDELCYGVTRVVFANTIKPQSAYQMLAFFENLKSIDFAGKLDLSDVTNLGAMFDHCTKLESLDMSGLKLSTDKLLNFGQTFSTCRSLKTITLPVDIKLETIDHIFIFCEALTQINNLNTWDVSAVSSYFRVFEGCTALEELDLSKWALSTDRTTLNRMFTGCSSLKKLTFGTDWNTSGVHDMSWMFSGCSSLTTLDIDGWDTSSVTDMQEMFMNCTNLTLDCSGWDVSNVDVVEDAYGFCGNKDFNTNAPGVTAPTWLTAE